MAKIRRNSDGLDAAKDVGQHSSMKSRSPKKSSPSSKRNKVKVPSPPTGAAKSAKRPSKPKILRRSASGKEKSTASKQVTKRKLARPRTSKQFFALPDAQQETWNRVVHVIAKMRAEGTSLTQASREFGLDPRVVRARAGSALRKTKSGRYSARSSDKLLRVLVIPSPEGLKEIVVRDSATASKIAEYSHAVQVYLRTGDSSRLKKFRHIKLLDEKGKRIKLVTDMAELQTLGSAGVLSFESLYARTA
jgi:lambda repressor-like predicted transcriptional regulator